MTYIKLRYSALKPRSNQFEEILVRWAAKETSSIETAKELAHEVEFAYYHKQPIVSKDSRCMEYLAALLRDLARAGKE